MSQRYNADRRRFMLELGSVLVLLPAGGLIAACSGIASTNLSNEVTFTSSLVDNHTHEIRISTGRLASPHAAGESLVTSPVLRHVHVVELTQAEMNAIQAGQTITKTTSFARGHAHVFTFVNSTSVEAPTSPSPTSTPTPTPY